MGEQRCIHVMQDRPDTVPLPSPRTAKQNVRELRALRQRVEELQSKLEVSGSKSSQTMTSPRLRLRRRSPEVDIGGAMKQSASLPEIRRQRHSDFTESQSAVSLVSTGPNGPDSAAKTMCGRVTLDPAHMPAMLLPLSSKDVQYLLYMCT